MNGIVNAMIAALSTTLLHSLWQGAVILGVVALWLRVTRADARARYLAVALALASFPLLAIVTFVRAYRAPALYVAAGNLADPDAARWLGSALEPAIAEQATGSEWQSFQWPAWGDRALVLVWAMGVSLLLLRQLGAMLWLHRSLLANAGPLPANWAVRCAALAERAGVRAVRFVLLPQGEVPFALGWLRQLVVVPAALLTSMPAAQLELLLLHELTHLRRWDYLLNLLQTLVESLFFFHPAVWWLSRRLRNERELACDETMVSAGANRVEYARALTELEARRAPRLTLAASGGELTNRVRALLAESAPRRRSPMVAVIGALALPLVGIAVACSGQLPEEAPAELPAVSSTPVEDGNVTDNRAPAAEGALGIHWLPADVLRHSAAIRQAAAAQSVDAQLVALIVLVESGGDPTAQSPVGARGLMQLMPSTAARLAASMNILVSAEDLDNPTLNLRLGSQLLHDLLARYDHESKLRQIELALASYNAGDAAVQAHLRDGTPLPTETQRYTRLLLELYKQRDNGRSEAYDSWRARVHSRWREGAVHPLANGRLTSAFGERVHPTRNTTDQHRGIDLAHAAGAPVLAPLAGVVEQVDKDADRGVFVVVRHSSSLLTRYHHLGQASVRAGQSVLRGDALGTVGSSGVSTGPHLHFEVLDQGEPIDPALLLTPPDAR